MITSSQLKGLQKSLIIEEYDDGIKKLWIVSELANYVLVRRSYDKKDNGAHNAENRKFNHIIFNDEIDDLGDSQLQLIFAKAKNLIEDGLCRKFQDGKFTGVDNCTYPHK